MEWPEYKTLCDQPDHWSRWMLEQCLQIFLSDGDADLVDELSRALQTAPLAKPADHRGPRETDMFRLSLEKGARMRALRAVERRVDASRSSGDGAAAMGRGYAGFVEAWREYASFE